MQQTIEITELREIDGDWIGGTTGYFAKGTHDPQQFAIAINQEFELVALGKNPIHLSQVEHGFLRKIPVTGTANWVVQRSNPGNGAFPATFVFL